MNLLADRADSTAWDDLRHGSILVTGASGLVGLNLLKALLTIREEFTLDLEIFASSKSGPIPPGFFGSAAKNDIEWFTGDLLDPISLGALPATRFTVHAATYGQPAKFIAQGRSTLLLNSQVISRLLDLCENRFLFLSSSEVYNGLEAGLHTENQIGTTGPLDSRAPYIEAKRFGETLCLHTAGTPQVANVARLSLAYGPGCRIEDRRVLNELIIRGLTESKVELRGGADQIRSYIFVEDAIFYLLKILLLGRGEVYNVGGLEPLTLGSLAEIVANQLGLPAQISESLSGPVLEGAPREVRVDMRKSRQLVGEINHYPLEEGIRATIDWYRSLIASSS